MNRTHAQYHRLSALLPVQSASLDIVFRRKIIDSSHFSCQPHCAAAGITPSKRIATLLFPHDILQTAGQHSSLTNSPPIFETRYPPRLCLAACQETPVTSRYFHVVLDHRTSNLRSCRSKISHAIPQGLDCPAARPHFKPHCSHISSLQRCHTSDAEA